ncbi:MAG: hypothetical protein HYZ54_12360, partial [Ignavibacteriae bacterium]|nr:hypothetical protein [Ignavibacteriota bacterium]
MPTDPENIILKRAGATQQGKNASEPTQPTSSENKRTPRSAKVPAPSSPSKS